MSLPSSMADFVPCDRLLQNVIRVRIIYRFLLQSQATSGNLQGLSNNCILTIGPG